MRKGLIVVVAAAAGLAGCTLAPPPPAPLIAVPGPNKTQVQFAQDDAACRIAATQPVAAPVNGAQPAPVQPPAVAYLQCMRARSNLVEPLPSAPPAYYAYPAYPVFAGYGDYYPFLYGGDELAFGYWGGGRWGPGWGPRWGGGWGGYHGGPGPWFGSEHFGGGGRFGGWGGGFHH